MMVKQTRIVSETCELVVVRLQCGHCGREAVQPLNQTDVPKTCPFCREPWDCTEPGHPRGDEWRLVRALQNIASSERRLHVRFELDADPPPP